MLSRTGRAFLLVAGGALCLLQVKLSFDYKNNLADFFGEQKGAKEFEKGQEAWVGKPKPATDGGGDAKKQ